MYWSVAAVWTPCIGRIQESTSGSDVKNQVRIKKVRPPVTHGPLEMWIQTLSPSGWPLFLSTFTRIFCYFKKNGDRETFSRLQPRTLPHYLLLKAVRPLCCTATMPQHQSHERRQSPVAPLSCRWILMNCCTKRSTPLTRSLAHPLTRSGFEQHQGRSRRIFNSRKNELDWFRNWVHLTLSAGRRRRTLNAGGVAMTHKGCKTFPSAT